MNLSEMRSRLTKLEKKHGLEELLASTHDGLPWNDFVWMLQYPAFVGAAIQATYMAFNAKEGDESPPVEEMLWLFVLVLIGAAMRFLHPLFRSKIQRLRLRVRKMGFVVPVALVQANVRWGDIDDWVHGAVLISFDPQVLDQPKLLTEAAQAIFALKDVDRGTLPKEQRAVAWSTYNELAPVRSIRVPDSLTNGLKDCIMAAALLPPKALWEGPLMFALAVKDSLDPNAVAVLPEAVLNA